MIKFISRPLFFLYPDDTVDIISFSHLHLGDINEVIASIVENSDHSYVECYDNALREWLWTFINYNITYKDVASFKLCDEDICIFVSPLGATPHTARQWEKEYEQGNIVFTLVQKSWECAEANM